MLKGFLAKLLSIKVLTISIIIFYFNQGKISETGLISLLAILLGYREYSKNNIGIGGE